MGIFLNKQNIVTHFSKLFDDAKSEIIMVVPYIKLTKEIIEKLDIAREKRIEIIIVYKESELKPDQRKILIGYNNITLLHHPNVHAKFYANEFSLIICSMNLYDYSIKNNREMGVLFDCIKGDNDAAIEAAFKEVRLIINSSTLESKSEKVQRDGFKYNLLKDKKERYVEVTSLLNEKLGNKKFEVLNNEYNFSTVVCKNYFENVDVQILFDYQINLEEAIKLIPRRVELSFNHPEEQVQKLHYHLESKMDEYKYKPYKVYWNNHRQPYFIYRDRDNFKLEWDKLSNEIDAAKELIKGADNIITDLKKEQLFKVIL